MSFPDKLLNLLRGGVNLQDALKTTIPVYQNDTWGPSNLESGQYGGDYIKLTDTQATTVAAGASIAGTQVRVLNTEDSDTGNNCKLAYALDYDAQTANFTVGLVVTGGTSGATGTIVADEDSGTTGTLWIIDVTGTFQDNETITDTSTGSATSNIPSGLLGKGFYLLTGTYRIKARVPAYKVNRHKAFLYNVNDSTNEIIGKAALTANLDDVITDSIIVGQFSITASKTFKINHYTQTAVATNGLGEQTGDGTSEIYTTVELWKIV